MFAISELPDVEGRRGSAGVSELLSGKAALNGDRKRGGVAGLGTNTARAAHHLTGVSGSCFRLSL